MASAAKVADAGLTIASLVAAPGLLLPGSIFLVRSRAAALGRRGGGKMGSRQQVSIMS